MKQLALIYGNRRMIFQNFTPQKMWSECEESRQVNSTFDLIQGFKWSPFKWRKARRLNGKRVKYKKEW